MSSFLEKLFDVSQYVSSTGESRKARKPHKFDQLESEDSSSSQYDWAAILMSSNRFFSIKTNQNYKANWSHWNAHFLKAKKKPELEFMSWIRQKYTHLTII